MDLLSNLNEPQRKAVAHVDGPLLVLAGAGSGKTRVITRRVANLVQQGIAPWHILAITFTNKAAGEMRERVDELNTPSGTTVCTFHSLCARLLREFADAAALEPNYSIYDRDDQIRVVKSAMKRLGISAERMPPTQIHSAISNAKNELLTAAKYAEQAGDFYARHIAQIYTEYEKQLKSNNAVDFDDLLLRMAMLLRDNAEIRDMLSQRYRYLLIDEYQDTNRVQFMIADSIARGHRNVCVTGDPDQSIYGWRGADISNILGFEQQYPGAEVIRLEENYRSSKAILNGASTLIAHNLLRKDKSLWTSRPGGDDVHVVYCENEHAEADQIAQRITQAHKGGCSYEDMAIFYRVNSLSRTIEENLLRHGIPYRIARGVEFYNRKEIKDAIAYLKLLSNPVDDLSLVRIINTPARKIGATTVNRLMDYALTAGCSMLESCKDGAAAGLKPAAAKRVAAFGQMMASLTGGLDRPVKEIMEDMLKVSGLSDALKRAHEEEDSSASANVGELVNTAAQFDRATDGGTLSEYLQLVSLVSDADHFEGGQGAVTLMTLHAAKGLEFPQVFMAGCEMGLLPFQRGGEPMSWGGESGNDKLEEERRLAFVGMTRSMDRLTMLCARRRMVHGRTESKVASLFLGEIGTDLVTVEDLVSGSGSFDNAKRPARGGFYEDADTRADIEALDRIAIESPFPSEYEYLAVGSSVQHSKFGRGQIRKIEQPWPETRVEVVFETMGPKRLKLSMARLEVLD